MTRSLLAKYDGVCYSCNEAIRAGKDTIFFYRRGNIKRITHVDCDIARASRKADAREAQLDSQYVRVEGPLPFARLPEEALFLTSWRPIVTHGFQGDTVRVYALGNALIMGVVAWDGWQWFPCIDTTEAS